MPWDMHRVPDAAAGNHDEGHNVQGEEEVTLACLRLPRSRRFPPSEGLLRPGNLVALTPTLVHALLRRLAELAVALLPADLPRVAKLTQRILDPNQYVRRGGGLSIAAWCVTRCVPQVLLHALRIC